MTIPPKAIYRFNSISIKLLLLLSLQSCLTLCDPTDGSPPGSPVPGILQARTLEWVAISFSSAGNGGSIPGSGRPRSGEGNGNPLQCSCLENPRDWGAWWAAVCGVTQSRTRLKRLSSSSSLSCPSIVPFKAQYILPPPLFCPS